MWAANEKKLELVEKKTKQVGLKIRLSEHQQILCKDKLDRGEKYSGGSIFLGYSGFAQDVDVGCLDDLTSTTHDTNSG